MSNSDAIQAIAVFGGSGATGQLIIEQALERGLSVKTLIRPASQYAPPSDAVDVIHGSILDPDAVASTIDGTDAIVCAFGPHPSSNDIFCQEATELIVKQMWAAGVERLICQTGAMIGPYPDNRHFAFSRMTKIFERNAPEMAADRAEQETAIRDSGLHWTIVKPPRLTNKPATHEVEAGADLKMSMIDQIPRADLATFLLDALTDSATHQQALFVRRA